MNPRISKTGKSRIMFLSKCEVRNKERTRRKWVIEVIKWITFPLSKIPLLGEFFLQNVFQILQII